MSQAQKVIKYFAFAFAVSLIVTILSSVFFVIMGISENSNLFSGDMNYIDFTKEFEDVKSLEISNYSGKIYVQPGEVDKIIVEAKKVPESFIAEVTNQKTLVVEDHNQGDFAFLFWIFDSIDEEEEMKITITLPKEIFFEEVEFDNGSGTMELTGVHANDFCLDGGSGNIIVSDISANNTEITTGSGDLELENVNLSDGEIKTGSGSARILNSIFSEVNIETGSGSLSFNGFLSGETDIDGGSGDLIVEVTDDLDNYDLRLNSGSGGIYVNGDKRDDEDIRNKTAVNQLTIKGGSGKVTLDFEN
jgi:DUF4097 and DUF4098 domain-containing protein YvlB